MSEQHLRKALRRAICAPGASLKIEDLTPLQFFRVITYSNAPIDLHAKGKDIEESSDMDIWYAISK